MTLIATKTVGEIAVSAPSTTCEFEKLAIDYCCGGSRTLGEACASANISVDEVMARLAHNTCIRALMPFQTPTLPPGEEFTGRAL